MGDRQGLGDWRVEPMKSSKKDLFPVFPVQQEWVRRPPSLDHDNERVNLEQKVCYAANSKAVSSQLGRES